MEENHYFNALSRALYGKYELLQKIGEGGMACVYKARQVNLNRIVALKIIHQNLSHDKQFVDRFLREARVCAALSHPNIITVFDIGNVDNVYYMAMEHVEGFDLNDIIESHGSLTIERAIDIIASIADALAEAHRQGVVHRDVKSSNILFSNTGRPVLMDFGIAYAASHTNLTQVGTIMGSPRFMSPEQALGNKMDARSDIYSLGVVLYHCLTGRLPFDGESHYAITNNILEDKPIPPVEINAEIPIWLNNIVLKCLLKKPENRYQSGLELSKDLHVHNAPTILEEGISPFGKSGDSDKDNKTQTETGSGNENGTFVINSDEQKPVKQKPGLIIAIIVIAILASALLYTILTRDSGKGDENVADVQIQNQENVDPGNNVEETNPEEQPADSLVVSPVESTKEQKVLKHEDPPTKKQSFDGEVFIRSIEGTLPNKLSDRIIFLSGCSFDKKERLTLAKHICKGHESVEVSIFLSDRAMDANKKDLCAYCSSIAMTNKKEQIRLKDIIEDGTGNTKEIQFYED